MTREDLDAAAEQVARTIGHRTRLGKGESECLCCIVQRAALEELQRAVAEEMSALLDMPTTCPDSGYDSYRAGWFAGWRAFQDAIRARLEEDADRVFAIGGAGIGAPKIRARGSR